VVHPLSESRLKAIRVDARRPLVDSDLLRRTHDGDIDAILVQGLYVPEDLRLLVQRLERGEVPFQSMDLPPGKSGRVLGHVLDLARPDLKGYLEDMPAFEAGVGELFDGIPEFEHEFRRLFSLMAGGRRVERLAAADGRPYLPYSFRHLKEGGFVRIHCEDEKLRARSKDRIREVATPHVSSFYLTLAPAATGGELLLHDLRWEDVEPMHLVNGRTCPERVPARCESFSYATQAGDLVIFGRGRVHEVSPVGPGSSRWTAGGFFCAGLDD